MTSLPVQNHGAGLYTHDSADSVVAARTRVDVAVLQLMRIAAIALRGACGVMPGVAVAGRINGSSIIAAVCVVVEHRLELKFEIRGTLRDSRDDVAPEKRRRGVDGCHGAEERSRCGEYTWHIGDEEG